MRATAVALVALALIGTSLQTGIATDEPVSIEVSSPAEQARIVGPTALVEVSGWGSVGPVVGQDLVLVIDVSGSTLLASGVDVNGNGKIGRTIGMVEPCTDPGDSIRAAEFVAARRVLEAVDSRRTHVGLVVFESSVRKSVAISTPREQLELTIERSQQKGVGTTSSYRVHRGRHELRGCSTRSAEGAGGRSFRIRRSEASAARDLPLGWIAKRA